MPPEIDTMLVCYSEDAMASWVPKWQYDCYYIGFEREERRNGTGDLMCVPEDALVLLTRTSQLTSKA